MHIQFNGQTLPETGVLVLRQDGGGNTKSVCICILHSVLCTICGSVHQAQRTRPDESYLANHVSPKHQLSESVRVMEVGLQVGLHGK